MHDEVIVEELKRVTAGLFFMSESDYPVEIIQWHGETTITPEYLRSVSGSSADSEIRETSVDNFFSANSRFREAVRLLKNNLADLKIYKVGAINIPVYIIGRSPEGNWLGLSTRVVET
jgi:nuclease A inhibitor-like protein